MIRHILFLENRHKILISSIQMPLESKTYLLTDHQLTAKANTQKNSSLCLSLRQHLPKWDHCVYVKFFVPAYNLSWHKYMYTKKSSMPYCGLSFSNFTQYYMQVQNKWEMSLRGEGFNNIISLSSFFCNLSTQNLKPESLTCKTVTHYKWNCIKNSYGPYILQHISITAIKFFGSFLYSQLFSQSFLG